MRSARQCDGVGADALVPLQVGKEEARAILGQKVRSEVQLFLPFIIAAECTIWKF